LVCQTVGDQFFLFCQNYIDVKLVCQTVGVALSFTKARRTFPLHIEAPTLNFLTEPSVFLPRRMETVAQCCGTCCAVEKTGQVAALRQPCRKKQKKTLGTFETL
jgi:hypothetical protein